MFVFSGGSGDSICLPEMLTRVGIHRDHFGFLSVRVSVSVNQLHVQFALMQYGCCRHAELNLETTVSLLKVRVPNGFAIDGVAGESSRSHE